MSLSQDQCRRILHRTEKFSSPGSFKINWHEHPAAMRATQHTHTKRGEGCVRWQHGCGTDIKIVVMPQRERSNMHEETCSICLLLRAPRNMKIKNVKNDVLPVGFSFWVSLLSRPPKYCACHEKLNLMHKQSCECLPAKWQPSARKRGQSQKWIVFKTLFKFVKYWETWLPIPPLISTLARCRKCCAWHADEKVFGVPRLPFKRSFWLLKRDESLVFATKDVRSSKNGHGTQARTHLCKTGFHATISCETSFGNGNFVL